MFEFVVAAIIMGLLFASCDLNQDIDSSSSILSVADSLPSETSVLKQYEMTPDSIIKKLNETLADNDYIGKGYSFDSNLIYDDYESITIYRTYKWMGININENIIVAFVKDIGEYKVIDLGYYGGLRISGIRPTSNPDLLRIDFLDGILSIGMGYFFNGLVSAVYYSLPEQKIVETEYSPRYNVCGMVGTKDLQQFGDCETDGKTATFRFRHISTDSFGMDGPEIILNLSCENGGVADFGFRNTELNLSQDFIRQVQSLEGVVSAEFEYIEAGLFTGTQLSIVPEPNYEVSCSFNQVGKVNGFDDFNVFCVREVESD